MRRGRVYLRFTKNALTHPRIPSYLPLPMDSFDNFQYDSASSYGGMGVIDDTSSVYTSNTQGDVPVDLERLSILDDHTHPSSSMENDLELQSTNGSITEDFDAVLDDLKEESQVDLPPHACWFVHLFFYPC
jgi:regulator of nonsense transcripts 1